MLESDVLEAFLGYFLRWRQTWGTLKLGQKKAMEDPQIPEHIRIIFSNVVILAAVRPGPAWSRNQTCFDQNHVI